MYQGKSVAVVVPAYNEEGLVGQVLDSIPDFVDRVYAVDDCSTDGTWAEIRDWATASPDGSAARTDGGITSETSEAVSNGQSGGRDTGVVQTTRPRSGSDEQREPPRITPIRHDTNRGVGAAIKTGYRHARQDRMDVTAVINGDGQMDPEILDRFLDPIVEGEADYAKGNRLESRDLYGEMSTWRFGGNVALTFLTKIASGYWKMTDPQNGYTAISLSALDDLDLEALYDGYGFLNDLLVNLNAREFRVADVSMEAVYGEEESGISYSSFIPGLSLLLLQGFLWRLKVKYFVTDFHPLVFLYALGALGSVSGLGYAVWATSTHAILAAGVSIVILLLSGALVSLAMVFDKQHNDDLQPDVST